eukprot:4484740-Pleurochrysis_carterae.AAC.1
MSITTRGLARESACSATTTNTKAQSFKHENCQCGKTAVVAAFEHRMSEAIQRLIENTKCVNDSFEAK